MQTAVPLSFADHLEKLELLSLATRRLCEPIAAIANAEKTLGKVWDILAASIPGEGSADTEYLGTLSSIIQRTASATKQIQSLESDAVDIARKALAFETARQTLLQSFKEQQASGSADGLSAETITLIEERLRLM